MTQIIRIDTEKIEWDKIRAVAGILESGGIIIYPTDTFYGLGADCFSAAAVKKAYALKKRELSKPLSVVVSDMEMLLTVAVDIPAVLKPLAGEFWPGPLTVILRAGPLVPRALLGSKNTIGVRIPAHSWLRRLIGVAGFPITATSANLSGAKEIADPAHAVRVFRGKVAAVVDGGPAPGRSASTIVDLTAEKPVLVRKGAVRSSRLEKFIL